MSTQIVDDEHIRVMVWAGLRPHRDGPLSWQVDRASGRHSHHSLDDGNAAQVGAMLHDQNVRAYEDRYGDEDEDDEGLNALVGTYLHAAPQHTGWTPVDLFRALQFYTYQAFHDEDYDEATSVEALQFCAALIRRLGPDLPGWGDPSFPGELMETTGWKASPWGITSESAPT